MASKKPLCHYSGYTKQVQPGDALVADYVVIGSPTPIQGAPLEVNSTNANLVAVFRSQDNDSWIRVADDSDSYDFGVDDTKAAIRVGGSTVIQTFTTSEVHTIANASVDGNLVVGGNMTVIGSMNVESSTLYEGSNQFGVAASDIQLLVGQITASGPFTISDSTSPFVARGNASIDGAITAPSAQITSLDITTATIPKLVGNVWITGNASIDSTLNVNATAHFPGPSFVTIGSSLVHPDRPVYMYHATKDAVLLLACGDSKVGLALSDVDSTSDTSNQIRCTGDVMSVVARGYEGLTVSSGYVTARLNFVATENASVYGNLQVDGYTNDLRITATPTNASEGSGMKTNMVAGEALIFGDFCYMKTDGKLGKADADAGTTTPTIAMALETIANNASGDFLLDGFAFDTAWAWTVGSTLYTSVTAGDIGHVIPSGSGDQVQIVGIAIHADRIRFSPSLVRVEVA